MKTTLVLIFSLSVMQPVQHDDPATLPHLSIVLWFVCIHMNNYHFATQFLIWDLRVFLSFGLMLKMLVWSQIEIRIFVQVKAQHQFLFMQLKMLSFCSVNFTKHFPFPPAHHHIVPVVLFFCHLACGADLHDASRRRLTRSLFVLNSCWRLIRFYIALRKK